MILTGSFTYDHDGAKAGTTSPLSKTITPEVGHALQGDQSFTSAGAAITGGDVVLSKLHAALLHIAEDTNASGVLYVELNTDSAFGDPPMYAPVGGFFEGLFSCTLHCRPTTLFSSATYAGTVKVQKYLGQIRST